MRPPRPGSRWSTRRLARRCRYAAYIDSRKWLDRRERWHADHLRLTGAEPVCVVCGQPWRLRADDLHHASYTRLGDEAHRDLIPMCRADHQALHELWDTNPAWRRLGRERATAGIVAALRRRHGAHTTRQENPA
jgi:hypothetical protein